MYQRTHSWMMSASNTRLRYIGSRAIGFVIQHLGQTKSGNLSDVPGCTRTFNSLLSRFRGRRSDRKLIMRIDGSSRLEVLISPLRYTGTAANRSPLVSKAQRIRAFFAASATAVRA